MKRRIKRSKKKKIKSVINLCMGTIVGINMSPIYTLAVGDIYNFNNVVIVASNDMLDEINMEKVSFNDVRLTLANNQKIDEEYKKYISEYIDRLEERLPEIDLRIFNKNLETLRLKVVSNKYWNNEEVLGLYNFEDNYIQLKKEYETSYTEKRVIFHELTHVTNSAIYKKMNINDSYYYVQKTYQDIDKKYGKGTMEAMTEIITDYLLSFKHEEYFEAERHNYLSYTKEANTIYQLLKLSDEYSIYDYFNNNIYKLKDELAKYELDEVLEIIDTELSQRTVGIDLCCYQNKILKERFQKDIDGNTQDELTAYRKIRETNIGNNETKIEIIDNIYKNSFIDIERTYIKTKEIIPSTIIGNGVEKKDVEVFSNINIEIYNGEEKITNNGPEQLFFYKKDDNYHIGYIENTYILSNGNHYVFNKYYDVETKEEVKVSSNEIIFLNEFLEYLMGINNDMEICYNIKIDISKINMKEINEHLDFKRFLKVLEI